MMDVRNVQRLLRQMNTEQIEAEEVLIRTKAGITLSIKNPQVVKMEVIGQTTFQVVGTPVVEAVHTADEEDVKLVMEKTGAPAEDARKALEESKGDIAEAIMKLKKD